MKQTAICLLAGCLSAICLVSACSSKPKRQVAEAPPPAYQPPLESTPIRLTEAAPPKSFEVQQAVKRVFRDAAVVDSQYNPNFLSGDFNGDGSQDLAVIVRPVILESMNQELPPWLVREPRANRDPRVRLRVDKDEALLAVIHGYGPNDWRDPDATQTFVLKNVAANDLKVEKSNEFVAAHTGRKLPRPQGDLIGGTIEGAPGYLYYASASYAWYDPKTYKGETVPGMFHKPRPNRK